MSKVKPRSVKLGKSKADVTVQPGNDMAQTLGALVQKRPTVEVRPEDSLVDVARALCASRSDAALVVNQEPRVLEGILSVKDLARALSRSVSMDQTTAQEIMTSHPTFCLPDQKPADALRIMQQNRFRHLPIIDPARHDPVLGICDVLELAQHAIEQLTQRSQSNSQNWPWSDILGLFGRGNNDANQLTIGSILPEEPSPTVPVDASIREATQSMASSRASALLVLSADGNLHLRGILSGRDIVTRVIAKNLDADEMKVAEIMTPNPETVDPACSVLRALQQMRSRGFRHLPVVNPRSVMGSSAVCGMVDVLLLASTTLGKAQNVIEKMDNERGQEADPLFNDLFHEDISGDRSQVRARQNPRMSIRAPSFSCQEITSANLSAKTPTVTFKFRDVNGDIVRIAMPSSTFDIRERYDQFLDKVRKRYRGSRKSVLKLKYCDGEGDEVLLANDEDLQECLTVAKEMKLKTIQLKITAVNPQLKTNDGSSTLSAQSPPRSVPDDAAEGLQTKTPHLNLSGNESLKIYRDRRKAIADADAALKTSDFELASNSFSLAISLDSRHYQGYYGRGLTKMLASDFEDSEKDLLRAVGLLADNPTTAENGLPQMDHCLLTLAEVQFELKKVQLAINQLKKVQKPELVQSAMNSFVMEALDAEVATSQEAYRSQDFADAIPGFSRSIHMERLLLESKMMPGNYKRRLDDLLAWRGLSYLHLKDYSLALQDFQSSLESNSSNPEALVGKAESLLGLGDSDRAKKCFKQALKSPQVQGALRARALKESGKLSPSAGTSRQSTAEIKNIGAMLKGLNIPKARQ